MTTESTIDCASLPKRAKDGGVWGYRPQFMAVRWGPQTAYLFSRQSRTVWLQREVEHKDVADAHWFIDYEGVYAHPIRSANSFMLSRFIIAVVKGYDMICEGEDLWLANRVRIEAIFIACAGAADYAIPLANAYPGVMVYKTYKDNALRVLQSIVEADAKKIAKREEGEVRP